MPGSLVESGHRFSGMIFCKRGVGLDVSVEMIGIDGCHACVIHMTEAMPYTVFFIHAHMTHLHGQKIFQCGLPDIIFVHVFADLKNTALVFSIAAPGTIPDPSLN